MDVDYSQHRGIRAMGFERVFQERFEGSVESALSTGVRVLLWRVAHTGWRAH